MAAIRLKKSLFYLPRPTPKFFTARSRVVKQSLLSLSGQHGGGVNKGHIKVSPRRN